MKTVLYHVTYLLVNGQSNDYQTQCFFVQEKTETTATAIHNYEAFISELENSSGHSRYQIIIINSLKFE